MQYFVVNLAVDHEVVLAFGFEMIWDFMVMGDGVIFDLLGYNCCPGDEA